MMTLRSLILLLIAASVPSSDAARSSALEREFQSPPSACRPWVYWMWMDGNSSREGITADLEAMARAGIGGALLMEVDVGIPKGPVKFMGPEWRQLFKHAVAEAERLGLQLTLNAGPGWTGSGGPWVKPEQSMQHVVASVMEVAGPTNFSAMLPRPTPRRPYFGTDGLPAEMLKAQRAFYQDVAVLAFPTPEGQERVADLDEKALYLRHPFSSMPGVKPFLPALSDYPALPSNTWVASSRILDLSRLLGADGRLSWNAPSGKWTVMRLGRTSTGANTRPAPAPGLGLECDKFDPAALDAHFDQYASQLLREIGPGKRRDVGWTSLHIDSWEMGSQNWTARYREEFLRRRGYDPLRYLPAMTGLIVDSREITERFLWDMRQTAQELVIENHARHLKELAHRHGLALSIEPYDMNPTADLNLGAVADVPMCEFWANCFETWFSCFEASSIAHTHGKRVVAAESFTSDDKEQWRLHPATLKSLGDWSFCRGVNRIVFHRYAHQPWLDRYPGMTMGPYGVHWERTQTWWDMAGEYHRYLARCQTLLRQGEAVAEILYLTPEGAPHAFRPPASAVHGNPPDHGEYNFDACSPETLMALATVERGRVAFPGGTSYRLLVLPDVETATPALLRKVEDLAKAGATVVGAPPRKSPSLSGYPRCDAEVKRLAQEIWGAIPTQPSRNPAPQAAETGQGMRERRLGKGRIVTSPEAGGRAAVFDTPERLLANAKWIWFKEGNPASAAPVGQRFFQRAVVLPEGEIDSARLAVTADNGYRVWVNGREAGSGDNFHFVHELDLAPLLKAGTNLLAIQADNGGDRPNPAGLIAGLQIRLRGGRIVQAHSDASWQAAQAATEGWQNRLAEGIAGTPAVELGPFGMSPWGRPGKPPPSSNIFPGYASLAAWLRANGVPPDFESSAPLRYTHRQDGAVDIYFVANPSPSACLATATFRVTGKAPELWNPLSGEIRPARSWQERNGRCDVPLRLEGYDSLFVVFRKPAKPPAPDRAGRNWDEFVRASEIRGPWEVRFQAGRGAPERMEWDALLDWSKHTDPAVRFFSGRAAYRTAFSWKAAPERNSGSARQFLDLGRVEVMARVKLNGHEVGTVWKSPFRLEITKALKAGQNDLEVEVANLWPNRLIGDASLPKDQRIAWSTWSPFTANTPLLESGLIGPVTIQTVDEK